MRVYLRSLTLNFENNVRITCVPIRNMNYTHWFKLWRRLEEYKQSGYNPDKFVKITYNWRQLGKDQEWYNMMVNCITMMNLERNSSNKN